MTKTKAFLTIVIVIIIAIAVWIYFTDKKEETEYQNEIKAIQNSEIRDEDIEAYITQANLVTPTREGKVFIAFEKLSADKIGSRATYYVWATLLEYYVRDGRLEKGSGASLPLAIYFIEGKASALNAPRDGSYYTQDVQKIFPDSVKQKAIFTSVSEKNALVNRLLDLTKVKAQKYYNITSISIPEATTTDATSTPEVSE